MQATGDLRDQLSSAGERRVLADGSPISKHVRHGRGRANDSVRGIMDPHRQALIYLASLIAGLMVLLDHQSTLDERRHESAVLRT